MKAGVFPLNPKSIDYVQHNGVAMGAPLAPVVADIFMAHMETSLMDQLMESGVCEWHRYVDDTFVLIEPTTNVVDVLNILNSFHPSIKFTYEVEANRSLPFLDVRVTRSPERQTFETTIYRKPTFTGLMTKWDSFVPMNYKKASIDSMIRRALSICSTYASLVAEFDEIRRISQANDYPISFIDTHIGMGLSRYMAKKNNTSTPKPIGCDKKRMYVEIPYVGRTTESMKKKFSHLSGKLRPDLDVCFFMKPPPWVRTFFQNKDPVAKQMQSNIVYSVNCNDCGQTYVGKTDRQAIRRMNEHGALPATFEPLRTTKRKPAASKPTPAITDANDNDSDSDRDSDKDKKKDKVILSALCKHEKDTGHHINWKDFRVVWRDENSCRLLVKESLVIQAYKPELNRTTHSVPLIVFPDGLTTDMLPDPNSWTNVFSPFSLSPFSRLTAPICSNFNYLCVRLSNSSAQFEYLLDNDDIDSRNVEFCKYTITRIMLLHAAFARLLLLKLLPSSISNAIRTEKAMERPSGCIWLWSRKRSCLCIRTPQMQ